MARKLAIAAGAVFLAWFGVNLALGTSGSAVELGSNPTAELTADPRCTTVHTYFARGWTGHELARSDVWLTGCKNSSGQMRIQSGPTCSVSTVFGPGTARCSSVADGSDLRVTVTDNYPFLLGALLELPDSTTFRIDPGGGYNAP